jgi:hypothetical protein
LDVSEWEEVLILALIRRKNLRSVHRFVSHPLSLEPNTRLSGHRLSATRLRSGATALVPPRAGSRADRRRFLHIGITRAQAVKKRLPAASLVKDRSCRPIQPIASLAYRWSEQ